MKNRIALALLAITGTVSVQARYYNDSNEVAACVRECPRRDARCRVECRQSIGENLGTSIVDAPFAAVQTGSLGLIPTTSEAVHDYRPVQNFGRGVKRLGQDTVGIATVGLGGRDWERDSILN